MGDLFYCCEGTGIKKINYPANSLLNISWLLGEMMVNYSTQDLCSVPGYMRLQ